jgi:hypothetical protein
MRQLHSRYIIYSTSACVWTVTRKDRTTQHIVFITSVSQHDRSYASNFTVAKMKSSYNFLSFFSSFISLRTWFHNTH